MTAYQSQTVVQNAHSLAQLLITVAFVISALRKLFLQLRQLFLNLMILLKSRHRLLKHRLGGMDVFFLREVADGDIVRHHHSAMRRLLKARNDTDQRGFAGAVLTNQTDAVFFTNQKIDVGEKVLSGEMYAQILN